LNLKYPQLKPEEFKGLAAAKKQLAKE